MVKWHTKRSLLVCYLAIVLKHFPRSQVSLSKVSKAQKFALPLSGKCVSTRVGLAFDVHQTSAFWFAYTLSCAVYSDLKIRGNFKYDILSNYLIFIKILWCIQKLNGFIGLTFLWDIFSFKFIAYQLLQFRQISCAKKHKLWEKKDWYNVHCLESFKLINTFVNAVFTMIFVPCKNQTFQCCQWSCLLVRFFLSNL